MVKFLVWEDVPLRSEILGERIRVLSNEKWFIVGFIEFQQKINSLEELNPSNNAHLGIIRILQKEGLFSPSLGASQGLGSPPGKGKGKGKGKEDRGMGKETTVSEVVKPKKEPNAYFSFIEDFGNIYQQCTGNPFHKQQKHFALVKKLIDMHGIEAVENKAKILAYYCKESSSWFTKNGFADFTIEKLSSQWNSILPQVKMSQEEINNKNLMEELNKQRTRNEQFNTQTERNGSSTGGNGTKQPVCVAGQADQ
jgi:hypothetical protein